MFLHFPHLHPELSAALDCKALPGGEAVLFLDPGLAATGAERHHRPETLPFDPRTARALLNDTLRYGESVVDPRDIAAQALVQQAERLDPDASRQVRAEVEKSILGGGTEAVPGAASGSSVDPLLAAQRQAQLLLLLAWSLEERVLDLRQAEARLQNAWSRLDKSVSPGEDEAPDDDADEDSMTLGRQLSGLTLPEETSSAMPWRRLVECFVLLAPGCALVTSDAGIDAALAEARTPEGPLSAIPGAARVYQAPAWLLMGHDREQAARPWLSASVTLGYVPAREGV